MRRPVLIVIAGPNGSGKTLQPRALLSSTSGQNNVFTDRAYFYDNSIDNQDAQILFRTIDGKFAKQYIEPLPTWTADIFDSVKE